LDVQLVFSFLRIAIGAAWFGVLTTIWLLTLVALLPSLRARARVTNFFARLIAQGLLFLTGSTYEVHGGARLDARRPAVYVSNHTSLVDIFIAAWLVPNGTVGIGKREITFYPLVGLVYLLSGTLRIDRKRPAKAAHQLKRFAEILRTHRLGVWLWPEGTRSVDGQLAPFKAGFVLLAIRAGLPVVPVVVRGAHRAWQVGTYAIEPTLIHIDVLEPIDTSRWQEKNAREHAEEVHARFAEVLGRPLQLRAELESNPSVDALAVE